MARKASPKKETLKDMPSTLKRSSGKAQRTWAKTHDSAVDTYGEGERAHRTAFSAVKHSFEKVGDRWEKKDRKGPSDPRAGASQDKARRGMGKTFGGVDVLGSSKKELQERAKNAGVRGYSRMTKEELAAGIDRAQRQETKRKTPSGRRDSRRTASKKR